MSTPSLPEQPEIQGLPPRSFPARLIGVFVSPRETFEDVVRKPAWHTWIAPLILVTISTVAVVETMLAKIGIERIIRLQISQSSRAGQMTPEQIEQQVQAGAKVAAIFTHVAPIFTVIFLLIVALVGLLVVNLILGGQINFGTSLTVVCYANVVTVLGGIMAIALILFGDPEHFNSSDPVPSNPGFFLDPSTSKPLLSLASSLDVFTFWMMGLLGIGYSEATGRKVKALSVFLVFVGIWVVITLIKMGVAMLM